MVGRVIWSLGEEGICWEGGEGGERGRGEVEVEIVEGGYPVAVDSGASAPIMEE